jgi:hypothetical protein
VRVVVRSFLSLAFAERGLTLLCALARTPVGAAHDTIRWRRGALSVSALSVRPHRHGVHLVSLQGPRPTGKVGHPGQFSVNRTAVFLLSFQRAVTSRSTLSGHRAAPECAPVSIWRSYAARGYSTVSPARDGLPFAYQLSTSRRRLVLDGVCLVGVMSGLVGPWTVASVGFGDIGSRSKLGCPRAVTSAVTALDDISVEVVSL